MNSITRIETPFISTAVPTANPTAIPTKVPTELDAQLSRIDAGIARILRRSLHGETLSTADACLLFETGGDEYRALLACADQVRHNRVGDSASFVITRNINFTNVCYMGCRFCNFAKSREHSEAEFLSFEEIADRAEQAWQRGATEVCVQGGLHPDIDKDFYRNLLIAIKQRVPDIHIHAFSPFEIWYGAKKARQTPDAFLRDLKAHGLGSMPGTAAEILDVEVRKQLTKNKLTTEAWVEIVKAAHRVGIRTTATIMYGHVDQPRHWAEHLALLREIQQQTGGFTEFVPLGFIHYETALYNDNPDQVRPGPTREEHFKMHAVARLMLQGQIDNIQASWVKMGPDVASQMLRAGANDLGGTLMNESISRAAGGSHGQEVQPEDMVAHIHRAGLRAVQRRTLYQTERVYPQAESQAAFCPPARQIAVAEGF
ncbi:5-amino-6-(D-ribitylamino)uracil--L-tyrosine 4-hydroxyphenyl transferase CofH [Marinobacterium arenosum]|uniref:5-amino-6-(D-ribitylamino)uracil--L-tyrosine 4-hydroxyphenyl transferase CofH n=1 Tax=Marinobacterium arenosum TaxID=2862496 RepID=UPI001C98819A|nr:5-amino-6-(D-ribitylamino)uracil--L-tyrosine 4-hydroxyphenyl transferase CofH [Marinobacterium arenosum]MBY4677014.1 5-amino-6-(D-ribitylamino)uracil--L-tyrosine 4-hydroxyphenyl transferase CofH [Marinobacterium arenosum]